MVARSRYHTGFAGESAALMLKLEQSSSVNKVVAMNNIKRMLRARTTIEVGLNQLLSE